MKKIYLSLIMIIMLFSLPVACVNDTGIQPDTSIPQQSQPETSPTGWPAAYASILEEYKTLAGYIYRGIYDIVDDIEWQEKNIPVLNEYGIFWEPGFWSMPFLEDKDAYGYALKDLNGDGSDELILLLKDYTVLAVFSTTDGKAKLVDHFAYRYCCCAIDKSGLFYIYGFDGSDDWSFEIYQLSDEVSELLLIAEYGKTDKGLKLEEEPYYYKVIDGEREIIKEAEFREFKEKHPAFADWEKGAEITESALVFIPILS